MNKNINVDEFFREKLLDYTETPPANAWEKLNQQLTGPENRVQIYNRFLRHYIIISTVVMAVSVMAINMVMLQDTNGMGKSLATSGRLSSIQTDKTDNKELSGEKSQLHESNAMIPGSGTNTQQKDNGQGHQPQSANGQSDKAVMQQEYSNDDDKQSAAYATSNQKETTHTVLHKHRQDSKRGSRKTGAGPSTVKAAHLGSNGRSIGDITPYSRKKHKHEKNVGAVASGVHPGGAGEGAIGKGNMLKNGEEADISGKRTTNKPEVSLRTVSANQDAINQLIAETQNKIDSVKEKVADLGVKCWDNRKDSVRKTAFHFWDYSFKAGYEFSGVASGSVFSAGTEYHINKKWSLMIQPALLETNINQRTLQGSQSFYKTHNDGKYSVKDSAEIIIFGSGWGEAQVYVLKTFVYSQTHDSIVYVYSAGGHTLSGELPLMLRYSLSKRFSVFGGADISISNTPSISEHKVIFSNLSTSVDTETLSQNYIAQPTRVMSIVNAGMPYTAYRGPLYRTSDMWLITSGLIGGASWKIDNRFSFDAMFRQNSATTNMKGGYNVNSALSSFYWRFMLGYTLK